jgi:hypothetical protein
MVEIGYQGKWVIQIDKVREGEVVQDIAYAEPDLAKYSGLYIHTCDFKNGFTTGVPNWRDARLFDEYTDAFEYWSRPYGVNDDGTPHRPLRKFDIFIRAVDFIDD